MYGDSETIIVARSLCFLNILAAQHRRGPPVTNAGLAPIGPWGFFLTWDAPTGADPTDLWAYQIKFGSFVINLQATNKIMFHAQTKGVSPGRPLSVEIVALYTTKSASTPMTIGMTTLPASKNFY